MLLLGSSGSTASMISSPSASRCRTVLSPANAIAVRV